jgi:hypothetical protein
MTGLKSIATVSTQPGKSIKDTLVDILEPLPKEQQLVELLNLFDQAIGAKGKGIEYVLELVAFLLHLLSRPIYLHRRR